MNKLLLLCGGVALASGFISYILFTKKFAKGLDYDIGSASTMDPDPFVDLQNQMSTRPITDEWVQQYNRFINGYREKPTMFPENYYSLPFRYEGPAKGILTSPGMPHPFFGGNPMDPEPNWHSNWIRQPFSF